MRPSEHLIGVHISEKTLTPEVMLYTLAAEIYESIDKFPRYNIDNATLNEFTQSLARLLDSLADEPLSIGMGTLCFYRSKLAMYSNFNNYVQCARQCGVEVDLNLSVDEWYIQRVEPRIHQYITKVCEYCPDITLNISHSEE